jgi:hypothetical protein
VKKKNSIIVLSALLSAAVVVLVCTDVKFNNPIDTKGTNLYENQLKEDSSYKSAGALDTTADGIANYFADPEKYRKKCDKTVPVVKLVGPSSVTITTQDLIVFKKWMRIDVVVWDSLITWTADNGNVEPLKPRLTRANGTDVPYDNNKVPDPGTYMIVYRVQKPECDGKTPGSETTRTLIVEQFVADDTTKPVINRIGEERVEVTEGDKYEDAGVTVTDGRGGADITSTALDSVVLKRNAGNVRVQAWTKPVKFSSIALPADAKAGNGFNITYYASRDRKDGKDGKLIAAPVTRNVVVIESAPSVGTKAVIVLTPYKHNIKGKVIEHPDTMMFGGTYVEKGARAYYVKDGAEVAIDANSVVKPSGSSTNMPSSVENPGQRSLAYTLPAGTGYSQADPVSRNVYLVVRGCDAPADPVITVGGDTTITAGTEWDYAKGWSVANKDKDGDQAWPSLGRKYLIDFDGLDPKKPKAGGKHNITYVGLGACGSIATKERTITVK